MAKAVLINTATLSQSIKLLREARSLIREEKNHLQNGHFFATRTKSGKLRMVRKHKPERVLRATAFCAVGALRFVHFYSKGQPSSLSDIFGDQGGYRLALSGVCSAFREGIKGYRPDDYLPRIDDLCLRTVSTAEQSVGMANDWGSHKKMLKLMCQAESLLRNLKKALQAAAGGVIGIPADQS